MSTLQTLDGKPLTWDELTANVDAWYERHGPKGLYGWGPEDTERIICSHCRGRDHGACTGGANGPYGWCQCACPRCQ